MVLALGPSLGHSAGQLGGRSQCSVLAVGWDVQGDGLWHGEAILHLSVSGQGMKGFGCKAGVGRTDHKGSAARREARTPPSSQIALREVPPSDLDLCLLWCLGMRLVAGALGAPDTDW